VDYSERSRPATTLALTETGLLEEQVADVIGERSLVEAAYFSVQAESHA
jgi:hypothetical protein